MYYLAGFLPCTSQEEMTKTITLIGAFLVFAIGSFLLLKWLGKKGYVGLLLAAIVICVLAFILYIGAGLVLVYTIGFCT